MYSLIIGFLLFILLVVQLFVNKNPDRREKVALLLGLSLMYFEKVISEPYNYLIFCVGFLITFYGAYLKYYRVKSWKKLFSFS